jgi:hypothetical protein
MSLLDNNGMVTGFFAYATSEGASRDATLIDAFTSQAPVLKHMQWSKANRTIQHIYREVTGVDGVGAFDLDGVMPDMKVSFQLGDVKLFPFGGRMELGEDTSRLMGSPDEFFREQSILLAREGGMRLEEAFFTKIVETAYAKGKCFSYDPNTPPSNAGTTITVVSCNAYETCALYSPAFQKPDGDFWELEKYHKGAVYPNAKGINVYGAYCKLMAGLLMANSKSYAVLRNVPLDVSGKDFPKKFAEQMAYVIDASNPNDKTTVLMSREYKVKLASAYAQFGTTNALLRFDDAFNLRIAGVPVIGSSNIPLQYKLPVENVEP